MGRKEKLSEKRIRLLPDLPSYLMLETSGISLIQPDRLAILVCKYN